MDKHVLKKLSVFVFLFSLCFTMVTITQGRPPIGDPGDPPAGYKPQTPSIYSVGHIKTSTSIKISWTAAFDDSRYGIEHWQKVELFKSGGGYWSYTWSYGQAHDGPWDRTFSGLSPGVYNYKISARSRYRNMVPPNIWYEYSSLRVVSRDAG
jgi:hypothetical protein